MNTTSLIIGLVFMVAPAVWVVLDSHQREGKARWILGALVPFTLWLTLAVYLVIRFTRRPAEGIERAGFPVVPALLAGVPALLFSWAVATNSPPPPQGSAAKPTVAERPAGPVNHFDEGMRLATGGDYDGAIREFYLVGPKAPEAKKAKAKISQYKAIVAEKKKAEAAQARRDALAQELVDVTNRPESFLELKKMDWRKAGFGSVAEADITIKNKSHFPIGDIEIQATFTGESGAEVGGGWLNHKTLNKVIQPGQSRTFRDVNFGFISDQAERGSVEIKGARVIK